MTNDELDAIEERAKYVRAGVASVFNRELLAREDIPALVAEVRLLQDGIAGLISDLNFELGR